MPLNPLFARVWSLALVLSCWSAVASAQPSLVPPTLVSSAAPDTPSEIILTGPVAVDLSLTVSADGSVGAVEVVRSSGIPALDEHALEAARRLSFSPALRDGLPIAARIPFSFAFAPAAQSATRPPRPVAPAAPAATAPPPILLEVRGERPPREATAHVVNAESARTMPGTSGDPLRAVETLPGVGRPQGITGDLIIRGSAPQDSLVIIDGVAIPYAYHFGGLSAVVPVDALDRIELRPGNFGPEYGRAMGGVVNLGMKAPRGDKYAGVLQLDLVDGRFSVQGPLGRRARFLIAGRRSWLDAWLPQLVNSRDVSFSAAPVYWDGQFVLDAQLTRRTQARLFAFGSDDRMALLFSAAEGDPTNTGTLRTASGYMRFGLRFDTALTDKLQMTHTLSWGPDKNTFHFGIERFDYSVQQLGLRSEVRYRPHTTTALTLGFDGQASYYELNFYARPYPATDAPAGPYFARPARRFEHQLWLVRPALYALLEITPWRGTRIVPSLRADYSHDTSDVTLDPRLSVRSIVRDGPNPTTLKGGLGVYHQAPQPVESVRPFGTAGVRSNRALHSSAGVEQTVFGALVASFELFYKHYDQLVVAVPDETGSDIGTRFQNSGSGRSYGGEVLLRYQPAGPFRAQLAYTLSRSQRRNQPGDPLRVFAYDQTHILSAVAGADLGAGFTLGARFRFVTGTPYTPYAGGIVDLDAGAYAAVPGAPYSARLTSFQQLDVRLDKTFKVGTGKIVAYLDLRNAYNHANAEAVSYRYDYAASKRVSGLPILPVLGLRGEL